MHVREYTLCVPLLAHDTMSSLPSPVDVKLTLCITITMARLKKRRGVGYAPLVPSRGENGATCLTRTGERWKQNVSEAVEASSGAQTTLSSFR